MNWLDSEEGVAVGPCVADGRGRVRSALVILYCKLESNVPCNPVERSNAGPAHSQACRHIGILTETQT